MKQSLLQHIKENSIRIKIFIDIVNCVSDHIHLLVSLGTEQTIAKTAMLIKGESLFWVNKQRPIKGKFEWQDEYIALSVSYSAIGKVRAYIENQETHHNPASIKRDAEEYEEFVKAHHFILQGGMAKANI